MSLIDRRVRFLGVLIAATVLSLGGAQAAPQIVAAVPTDSEAELVCADAKCSAEFSSICLQRSRASPLTLTSYVIHGQDRDAFSVTGHRPDGTTLSLGAEVLHFTSLREHRAFRVSAPAVLLESHGLDRLTVRIERLAMLMPVPEEGDAEPQTAADMAKAARELKVTGSYWMDMNPENLAMARLTNRFINRLPAEGSISAADGEALWRRQVATEQGLNGDALAFNRSYFDYCRKNALNPGGFPMKSCLGTAHDWFMKDLNVNYWKSLKPTS
ncbi:MAG: hypothetical protein V3R37_09265 [Rhodospirillales bacterium]